MTLNADTLAARISAESGLGFVGTGGRNADGTQSYQLRPANHPPAHTFTLRIDVGWRSIDLSFQPGNFSGDLIHAMGMADEVGRTTFAAVLQSNVDNGAQITLTVNGRVYSFDDPHLWHTRWQHMSLSMRRGMLPLNDGNPNADEDLIGHWVARLSAAILALLPLEADETVDQANPTEAVAGFPEGATIAVLVNRYERDRRNRAAALAIHGHVCKACDVDMGFRYGDVAAGLIELHHTTPVSKLGPNYVIDPKADLIPLCPNCHAVAHRRTPPYTVAELRVLVSRGTD